ncbi:MAG: HAD family phosphatase [Desulfobacteraceae bacterium]|jgi:HAD superfamily hydrolase (TIGR01509 family)
MSKGVIWDLDGVLADTAEAHFRCWVTALAEKEIPLDRPTFEGLFGVNNRDMLAQLLGRPPELGELESIAGRKEEIFRMEAQWLVTPMPGALSLLKELEGAGWIQAVTSTTPKADVELVLGILGIRQRFQAVLSGEDLSAMKPEPALFLGAAETLGLSPERCVVVEDAPEGVEAAYKAGMPCIAVATTNSREALSSVTSSTLLFDDLTHVTESNFSELLEAN